MVMLDEPTERKRWGMDAWIHAWIGGWMDG